jgi:HPt (histidine-containing phosphotransfer) domain-containing protein
MSVIDPQVFAELLVTTGGEASFMRELVDTYLCDAPGLLEQMRQSLATGNAEELRRAAHSLKSNSATFGAMSLAALTKELEMMAKAGQLAGAPGKVAQVEAEYGQVEHELKKMSAELNS